MVARGLALRLALAVFVAGCSSGTEPLPLPAGAVLMDPPPAIYETWWHEVESCSGKTGDFAAISWYYVPGSGGFGVGSGAELVGIWQPQHHSITLADYVRQDGMVVRHEMLHAILQRADHPGDYFVQKCGIMVWSTE